MSKRKRQQEPCANCTSRGEVGMHTNHLAAFCGYPGGSYYNAENQTAGRQAAAQAYFADKEAKKQTLQQLGGVGAGVAQFSAVVTQQATASSTAMVSLNAKVDSLAT